MKLLLTGLPSVGKTTLLLKLISNLKAAFWVVSEEIKQHDGRRIGFRAKTSSGKSGMFAHQQEGSFEDKIGKYKVDIDALDRLFSEPIDVAQQKNGFIVIDEIGRMQMLSPKFHQAIKKLFNKNVNILATIRHGDEWTREFTDKDDVITFTLTSGNQDDVQKCIQAAIRASVIVNSLPAAQNSLLHKMAKTYLANNQFVQFQKLFNSAVVYLFTDKVKKIDDTSYRVAGDHSDHEVKKKDDQWACDCDLFRGAGAYINKAGECSHIQAVKLKTAE